MRRTLLFLALSALAVPLFAEIRIDPAAPTSATPVTITVSGFVSRPEPPLINRLGTSITITLRDHPQSGDTGRLQAFAVPVGLLPPGDYEVIVIGPLTSARQDETMFFVSDANATLQILGPSIGPTTGGTVVIIDTGSAAPCQGPCTPTVTFNDVPASLAPPGTLGPFPPPQFVVIAPPNPKGIANVVVTGPGGTASGYVFRYYDPNDPPASSMFERVLFPIVLGGPGAYGSKWTSELTMSATGGFIVDGYRGRIGNPISSTPVVFPDATQQGKLLFVPRDVSHAIHFGSVVRDVSRQSDEWGTEVRVARASDFRTGLALLNIPVGPPYRLNLRIYGVDSAELPVTVRVNGLNDEYADLMLHSPNPCQPAVPCSSTDPAYVSIDLRALFPDLNDQNGLEVDVTSQQRIWAFLTVTNDRTQHVTTITPQ